MDAVHLHLIINHAPIFMTFVSLVVLIWGWIRSNDSIISLALVGFIAAAVFSIIAVESGQEAEEAVEHLAGVSEHLIHEHAEAAETANWIGIILGIAALGGLFIQKYKASMMKVYLGFILILGAVSAGFYTYTGYEGGMIRHTEIRPNNVSQNAQMNTEESEEHEENE